MTLRSRALSAAVAIATTVALAAGPATDTATAQTSSTAAHLSSAALTEARSYQFVHRSFMQAGFHREYNIGLPPSYDSSRSYPVIIGFGGLGDTAASYRDYAELEQVSGGQAIIIYAQGVNNAWAGAPYATTTLSQDIEYVRTAIHDITSNYSGNADHVFATGLSNGGGMVAALSCHAPELVDAVASVSGAYYHPTVSNCSYAAQVPTLLMHGTTDDLVAYEGGYRHDAPYLSVQRTFENFATRNGCTVGAVAQSWEYPGATTLRPNYCDTATEIVRVEDQGHTWFNEPAAQRVVWDFFMRQ